MTAPSETKHGAPLPSHESKPDFEQNSRLVCGGRHILVFVFRRLRASQSAECLCYIDIAVYKHIYIYMFQVFCSRHVCAHHHREVVCYITYRSRLRQHSIFYISPSFECGTRRVIHRRVLRYRDKQTHAMIEVHHSFSELLT